MKIELGRSVFGSMATNKKAALACALLVESLVVTLAQAAGSDPGLVVEARIPLGDVRGRIDHLAYDTARGRLFVAELGNDSVSVIDLNARVVPRRITGLAEPQGVAFSTRHDTLYVASGGDGTVRAYRGETLQAGPTVRPGDDADNVRLDSEESHVFVGFGAGSIAALDPETLQPEGTWSVGAHPEGFQLEPAGARIVVNVPDRQAMAVIDRHSARSVATWRTIAARANFPMAIDANARRVYIAYRQPATLGVFSLDDGSALWHGPSCGDADDVFIDARRRRAYVVCGAGVVEAFDLGGAVPKSLGRIPTAQGARTGLYIESLDRLFVAVRATGSTPAEVWVTRPNK